MAIDRNPKKFASHATYDQNSDLTSTAMFKHTQNDIICYF